MAEEDPHERFCREADERCARLEARIAELEMASERQKEEFLRDTRRLVELESELTIERGRVEQWKKDSHLKEKQLNTKCEEVARLTAECDDWEQRYESLLAQIGGVMPG